jgi:hypothetical protein
VCFDDNRRVCVCDVVSVFVVGGLALDVGRRKKYVVSKNGNSRAIRKANNKTPSINI